MLGLLPCGVFIYHNHILYIGFLSQTDQPPGVLRFVVSATSLTPSAVVFSYQSTTSFLQTNANFSLCAVAI